MLESLADLNNDAVYRMANDIRTLTDCAHQLKITTSEAARALEPMIPDTWLVVQSMNDFNCLYRSDIFDEQHSNLVVVPHRGCPSGQSGTYRDTSYDLIISYDKFLLLTGTPKERTREEECAASCAMFYNIGHAMQRNALSGGKNAASTLREALYYYQLAITACNMSHMPLNGFTTATLACLTNMAQIYANLWRPLDAHYCLQAIHQTIKDTRKYDSLASDDASFFCSNLTCACALQWHLSPAA